ncbi:LD-carboxypeptidase [Umezawaea endophytica]|uniref:LD-carboxypeptidase n=1 Tax=Umezawaea endophytica TaxID=1654476 RepID=A0A9X3A283_9PSEU|nr:LD-carboxypeptidase [Umezawaea endophytica]MCS7478738.1 LD-carboxypeptidase [Umezawaea endophytica]
MTGSAGRKLVRPRALRPGVLVVIASLSGPLHAAYEPDLQRAVLVLERMGFRVRRAPLIEAGRHRWWSAATPAEIAQEFNSLLRDPEVRAIIAHDGGQTVLGYLDLIDVDAVVADPKPILGYSDISWCFTRARAWWGFTPIWPLLGLAGTGRPSPRRVRRNLRRSTRGC